MEGGGAESSDSASDPGDRGEAAVVDGRPRWPWHRLLWGIVVPAVLAAGLAWFVWTERATLARVGEAPPGDLLLIAVLFAVGHFLNSTEFWLLYRATGARFGLTENWMLFTAGQLVNHLPAQMGTLYRLRYMRAVHRVPYLRSAAVYGANLVITLEAAALVGLVGVLGTAHSHGGDVSLPLVALFIGVAAGAGVVSVLPLPTLPWLGRRLAPLWERFHAGLEALRGHPRVAVGVCLLEAVKYGVTAWRIQVTFSLIGIHEPFTLFLVLAPAAGIASFIAVTPAALGFREAFITGAAAAMGLEISQGLLGATVDRAVMLATFLLLGGLGLLVTYPRQRSARG